MTSSDSLLPREHGAYAEAAFPIITGLALGRPTISAFSFGLAVTLGFLLAEPTAILMGTRGPRLKQTLAARARRRAIVLSIGLGVTGLFAMLTSPPQARVAALVPLGFVIVLGPSALAGRLKTMGGELIVAAAFATSLLPIAIASTVTWSLALTSSAVWFTTFALGTLSVHAIKASIKQESNMQWTLRATPTLAVVVMLASGALAISTNVSLLAALAFLPAAFVTLVVGLMGVHPRRLRAIGWSMVGSNLVTIALLLAV